MSQLNLEGATCEAAFVDRHILELIAHFTYEFAFGKSYLLDAELGKGAFVLCWMIGGKLKSTLGKITKDGVPYPERERLRDLWFVRQSEYQGFRAGHRTVKSHIQNALKKAKDPYLRTEQEIIERFYLTPARYNNSRIRQLSHEGWRVSCAIGLAHEKKIFCFPYVEYYRPYLIEEYFDLWLKDTVDLLRDSGALVLIPAIANSVSEKLCDEVVRVQRPFPFTYPYRLR